LEGNRWAKLHRLTFLASAKNYALPDRDPNDFRGVSVHHHNYVYSGILRRDFKRMEHSVRILLNNRETGPRRDVSPGHQYIFLTLTLSHLRDYYRTSNRMPGLAVPEIQLFIVRRDQRTVNGHVPVRNRWRDQRQIPLHGIQLPTDYFHGVSADNLQYGRCP
jgi:hypothetical protein